MKHRRYILSMISLILVISFLSISLIAVKAFDILSDSESTETEEPNPLRPERLERQAAVRGVHTHTAPDDSLPARYNSAELGYITPVRDQGAYNTCWAHSALASCEANILRNSIPIIGNASLNELNLSESHLSFFNYTYAYDALNLLWGNYTETSSGHLMHGGNGDSAGYTLMRWEGVADESIPALKYETVNEHGLSSDLAYQCNVAHVQNCCWISAVDRNAVKQAIRDYGAGAVCFYYDEAYFNPNTATYCCPIDEYVNHSVTVVGWDDNYNRNHFPVPAPANGAWIIKNSWGEDFGDNGYMYLSYYDQSSNQLDDTFYFFGLEPVDNYDSNYQYDGTVDTEHSQALLPESKACNVFTANGIEMLEAVAVNSWTADCDFQLDVVLNPEWNVPDRGTVAASQKGHFDYAGYYTVKLDNPVKLSKGDRFAVILTCKSEYMQLGISGSGSIAYNNGTSITWNSVTPDGCCFYKHGNSSNWTDSSTVGSFRIKAYTSKAVPNETGYVDVDESSWYYDSVLYSTKHALMNGVGDYCFAPDAAMTRAMLVTVLWRHEGMPKCEKSHRFVDVSDNEWYTEAISWAAQNGIVNGISETLFSPDTNITREQMATILYRYHTKGGLDTAVLTSALSTFPDGGNVDGYATIPMSWCINEGIIHGADGYLLPQGNASRAQVATTLMRYIESENQ